VGDVDFAVTKSVTVKWLEMGLDIVSRLAAFIPNGGGAPISLIITIFEDTYNNLTGSNGDINQAITQIYTELNSQKSNLNTTNAAEQTAYLTDYSKLQQIGLDHTTGGYDWANATKDVIADAQNGAAQGMLVNFYRTLIPYKWFVYWCNADSYTGAADCGSVYTQTRYDCNFGTQVLPGDPDSAWTSEAYIYAGATYNVNWALADKLTGTGKDDVNAIWYMMLMGSDAGWDLPGYRVEAYSYIPGSDPALNWPNLPDNPPPHNAGCNGNGSTTGQLGGSSQTLSQRLTMAQQNLRHVTTSEANGILEQMRELKQDAKAASPDRDVEIDLTSPLREAGKLLERAKSSTRPGQEGSVSATTPTHLTELFIRRVQLHTPQLGQSQAEYLTAKAYDLMAELEGQTQPDKPVSRCAR